MDKVIAYQTHYEIMDYNIGDCIELERKLSIFDKETHETNGPFYRYLNLSKFRGCAIYFYYDGERKILYVPRGFDDATLVSWFGKITYGQPANPHKTTMFNLTKNPRDNYQREAVRFLLGRDEYAYTKRYSQLGLSLPGGSGKTYCAVAMLSVLRVKSLIIVHNTEIREQWKARIQEYTDVGDSQIFIPKSQKELLDILHKKKRKSSLKEISFVICTHRLLHSFISSNGLEDTNRLMIQLGIGVKIIDEAHKEFSNTLLVDYATNVARTIYITATFGRSDFKENAMFNRCFDRVPKLLQDDNTMERKKTVFHVADFFQSHMNAIEIASITTPVTKKFSIHRYFALEEAYGIIYMRLEVWLQWYFTKRQGTGHMIIISPKQASCDRCAEIASTLYPEKKCTAHYSGHKASNLSDYDVICATSMMLGTGFDMDDLSIIINMEPSSSKVNIDQLIHRLMRGKSTEDVYYIELIDMSVPTIVRMYEKRKKVTKTFVKKIIEIGK